MVHYAQQFNVGLVQFVQIYTKPQQIFYLLKDLDVVAFDWLIVYCVFLCNSKIRAKKKIAILHVLSYTQENTSIVTVQSDICADLMVNHLFILHSIEFN